MSGKFAEVITRTALSAFRNVLYLLPESAGRCAGRAIGGLLAHFLKRERTIIIAQADFVKHRGYALETDKLPASTFKHSGEAVYEALCLKRYLLRQGEKFVRIETDGQQIVDKLLVDKQGAIALSAHLGCFELLAAFHAAYGVNISVIGRDPNYPVLGQVLRLMRSDYGVHTIWREDSSATRKLLRALKDGHVIAALIDQDTAVENCFAPFFSLPAAYPRGLLRLALKNNIPLVSSFIVRTAPGRHRVITEEFKLEQVAEKSEAAILSEFSLRLERLVLQYPEQWLWWHRRWRRREGIDYNSKPELLRSTSQYLEWLREEAGGEVVTVGTKG